MLKTLVLFFFLIIAGNVSATHNLAGDITYRHINGLTYEITVTIYADFESPAIARKEIEINWGDDTGIDSLTVTSETRIGSGNNSVLKRVWKGLHTYPGPSIYRIIVEDPNRNANVNNIDNSVNVPFTIISELSVISSSGSNVNNSVQLRNDPLDSACVGALFVYNAGAFDPDGTDSIAYRLTTSKGTLGGTAPGYVFPPASESITVDAISGNLIWKNPTNIGLYNIAILILEYRNGIKIGSVLRDIQISVRGGCNNNPPAIFADQLVCVEAGTGLNLTITSTDPDNDKVTLTATGELLEFPILQRVTFSSSVAANPANATFTWNTLCADVRKNQYNLSIKAEDNAITRQSTNLVNFRTVNIRVVSPAPENAIASNFGNSINVNWENLDCPDVAGYYVYRRLDSSGFVPSKCIIGVPDEIGFLKIATINDINITSYNDNNNSLGLIPGRKYCYLITKFFLDGDESYASNETCAEIEKIVPVITNVSIDSTSKSFGILNLAWSPPTKFDRIALPPPYRYLLQKFDNGIRTLIDSTNSIDDTTYLKNNLNTIDKQHTYRVDLVSLGNGKQLAGISSLASSIFLKINATDKRLDLSWDVSVPWKNNEYIIFRKLIGASNSFDSLTTTTRTTFSDTNLTNGNEYCYYIQSIGDYNLNSVVSPIINFSQNVCSIPNDNVPPCAPELGLEANCDNGILSLNWNRNATKCALDVSGYIIYKALTLKGDLLEFERINSPFDTSYKVTNDSVGGCYAITAIDSAGNISSLSNKICTEFCPVYELPNVFTPNGDGINDYFIPLQPYRYVDSIHLQIYNRYGEMVFQTEDPDIKWNGDHNKIKIAQLKNFTKQKQKNVGDGVYFYVCEVFELSLTPTEPRIIKGTVTILNNSPTIGN